MTSFSDAGFTESPEPVVPPSEPAADPVVNIDAHKITTTFFKDKFALKKDVEQMTLPELRNKILTKNAATKMKLEWLELAEFGDKPNPGSGCLRHIGNLLRIFGIETEHDDGDMPFDEAVAAVTSAKVRALAYTSPSHKAEVKERWRVLFPTSTAHPYQIREKFVARANGIVGGALADECFDLSRAYLYGSVNHNPDHRAVIIDGDFIDLRPDLDAGAIFKPTKKGNGSEPPNPQPKIDFNKTGNGKANGSFFRSVNSAALDNLSAWVPGIFSNAKYQPGTGSWRIKSSALGRGLEEDISIHPKGTTDWGTRKGKTAVDLVMKYGNAPDAKAAALWLCDRLALDPASLGWKTKADYRSSVSDPREPDWRERNVDGSPKPSMHNARLAITAIGVECSYDTFHNKMLFGLKDDTTRHVVEPILGDVNDDGMLGLRRVLSDRFGFDLTDQYVRDAVKSLALEHCFDPVADMLAEAEAKWDKVARLDRVAADYFNCEDTPLNAACFRKLMIAGVARVRQPGCKFDNILVLEAPEGWNKSTALRVLAMDDENFSDESIIGKDSREVQEQLSTIWLHENAELAGMRKADIETVKAFARRQVDRARPAYGHFHKKQPRHSIEVATTNSEEYQLSQTGNRTFWGMKLRGMIDLEKLFADRLQLWGEAAYYERQGESLVIDEALWPDAGAEQEKRRVKDAWEDILVDMPWSVDFRYYDEAMGQYITETHQIIHYEDDQDATGRKREFVASRSLLTHVLKIRIGDQDRRHTMRLADVMKHLGWQRNGENKVTIAGKQVRGYFR